MQGMLEDQLGADSAQAALPGRLVIYLNWVLILPQLIGCAGAGGVPSS